jgi:phosphatidate cytidylyltransferase
LPDTRPDAPLLSRLPTARIVASLCLAPIVVVCILLGDAAFIVLVVAAVTLLAREWLRMCNDGRFFDTIVAFLLPIWAAIASTLLGYPVAAVALLVLGTLVVAIATGGRPWLSGGVLYLGLPGLALVWLRTGFPDGLEIVLWLFLVVWSSDIGAYVAGRLLGGPKLAPRISPNKTWSGAVGGLMFAGVCGGLFAWLARTSDPAVTVVASIGLSIVAQAGDLAESQMKRHFGVKDTGTLIPGHGGLLDRLDSLLLGAVATAALALTGKVPV